MARDRAGGAGRSRALVAAAALLGIASSAGAQAADTAARGRPFFVPRDAAALGIGVIASAALTPFDRRIARWTQSEAVQGSPARHRLVQRATKVNETTLTLAGLLAYGAGRLTHATATADVALHTTEAIVLTSIVSQSIRGPLGRSRPYFTHDSSQFDFHFMKGFGNFAYRAYPSLHAATAYAAAAALVTEVRERHPGALWYAAPLAYGAASIPGLTRMYLDDHWASDIVMGGVIGVLLGTRVVAYQHHPTPVRGPASAMRAALLPVPGGGVNVVVRYSF